ncbi:cysteine hydrolase family protein [Candidatus Laterigemmans baculatus]|uniref:cysteine hydrolase family protein n=1 Tax=Candidatus Laterigemmans baculatus TaxID=2770505 RepID=UPI001F1CB91E|nr:isochorismatase family cysteine hydrolase [Candidatus Laterigemmans baculatus]
MRKTADNDTLSGMAPDHCPLALVLIDVINDLEFPGAEALQRYAEPMAERLAELRRQAHEQQVPVIYVNDNFGRWRGDFALQVRHCLEDGVRGQRIAELLQPDEHDYFILKPKHSGFHLTPLSLLLESMNVQGLILTGLAGNICVLFTAHDAYMRQYDLIVPRDCIASEEKSLNQFALTQMERVMKAEITSSTEIDLSALLARYS